VDVVVRCDNCSAEAEQRELVGNGQAVWQAETRERVKQERVVIEKLDELAKEKCAYCWGILHKVFDRENSSERRAEEAESEHSVW
jgi:hypothetical protein